MPINKKNRLTKSKVLVEARDITFTYDNEKFVLINKLSDKFTAFVNIESRLGTMDFLGNNNKKNNHK